MADQREESAANGSVRTQPLLQDSEERFRLLVESVKDYAIFMLDPDGHIISWKGSPRMSPRRVPPTAST